eukprot:5755358-Pleurochrysis_carterae.AAC.1
MEVCTRFYESGKMHFTGLYVPRQNLTFYRSSRENITMRRTSDRYVTKHPPAIDASLYGAASPGVLRSPSASIWKAVATPAIGHGRRAVSAIASRRSLHAAR